MNRLEILKTQHTVPFCVLIAVTSLFLLVVGSFFASFLSLAVGNDYYLVLLAQELFAMFFILLIARASHNLYPLTRRGAGLGHALQVAAYPVVLVVMLAVSMATYATEAGGTLQPAFQIIIFVLGMLSIGMVEEMVFRGIIAESLIQHYGTSYKNTWKATFVSGVIFGFAHASNLFAAAPLGVFVQVVVAIVLGMMFAAIYYRTGNLWICVLLHAGINGSSLLQSGLYGVGTLNEMVSSFSLANLTPCITYGIPVVYLLRRARNHEVQFWFGGAEDV